MHVHVSSSDVTLTDTSPASAVRGPAAASAPAEQAWTPRLWGVLAVLCAVLFLDGLDVSMVGVALPSIGTELGLSTTSLQWIVNGYVLGYGGLPSSELGEAMRLFGYCLDAAHANGFEAA